MVQKNNKKRLDMIGKKINKLEVIAPAEMTIEKSCKTRIKKHTSWLCRCECGNTKIITQSHLVRGVIKSCGCLRHESRTKKNLMG